MEYSNSDLKSPSRFKVIDIAQNNNTPSQNPPRHQGRKQGNKQGKRGRNRSHSSQSNFPVGQWPLEALPIQRVVIEYGRRTAALQAQQDAQTLRNIANRIRSLGIQDRELELLIRDVEETASNMQMKFQQAYSDDDD